jgi:hypothetical protein
MASDLTPKQVEALSKLSGERLVEMILTGLVLSGGLMPNPPEQEAETLDQAGPAQPSPEPMDSLNS